VYVIVKITFINRSKLTLNRFTEAIKTAQSKEPLQAMEAHVP
jgi:hypothetical protein